MARQTYAPRGALKSKADPMSRPDPMSGPDPSRCKATSKQTGKQCGRPPIPGGTVCRYHGGAAPQVMAKANDRLTAYQDKAIDRLFQLAEQTEFPSTALGAVKDVLDRTMGKAQEKVDLNVTADAELVARLTAARLRNR
jgi:hypothetical protein